MKRWARWTLFTAAAVLALAASAVITGHVLATRKMNRHVPVSVTAVALPTDAAATATAIERGRYLYASRGCVDCHGSDGGGRQFLDTPMLKVRGPHISPGPGSVTAQYAVTDWVRTIRHGVKPDGRPALIMPSEDYNRFTDVDVAALVSYLRQMPPAQGGGAVVEIGLPLRLMVAAGVLQDAAAKIDHSKPPQLPVEDGPTVEHGRYVANMCIGCHGQGLSGGRIPGVPPDWPAAANLTPGAGSAMARYPDADSFARMFRSGRRPDGSTIGVMPFESLAKFNDTDLEALHAYLQTVPAKTAAAEHPQDLARPFVADDARQVVDSGSAGRIGNARLALPEDRVLGSDRKIAEVGEMVASADGKAIDAGDYRLGATRDHQVRRVRRRGAAPHLPSRPAAT